MSERTIESCAPYRRRAGSRSSPAGSHLRRGRRAARRGSGGARRRGGRFARPERCGQDHPRTHRRHAHRSRRRDTCRCAGRTPSTSPADVRARLGLAGQFASVDELLTGRENLELIGRLYGIAATDCRVRVEALLVLLGLTHAADRRVSTYSGGMRRRLDLGATLIGEPSLLLLDEPTTGLDPRSRLELWDLIAEIARRGTGVLITSQNLEEIERLADRVIVLDNGRVIADDSPQALQRRIGGQVLDVGVDCRGPRCDRLARSARPGSTSGPQRPPSGDRGDHRRDPRRRPCGAEPDRRRNGAERVHAAKPQPGGGVPHAHRRG